MIMRRLLMFMAASAMALAVSSVGNAQQIAGDYLETRSADVWTGPCFANAEMNLGGKQAVMAWKVDKGSIENVQLDGLSVVAVLTASGIWYLM